MRTLIVIGLLAMTASLACGGGKCTTGMSEACTCTDGRSGAQTCKSDGTFDVCSCTAGAGGGSGGGAGSMKRVFVTVSRWDGNLGGLTGADAKCQTSADGANLGGTWKAWLSTSAANASDRITDVGPWFRLDGMKAFNNKANLATQPLTTVEITEQNMGLGQFPYDMVWTGTRVGGMASLSDCNGWTNNVINMMGNNALGTAGHAQDASHWTDDGSSSADFCDTPRRLYCLEQ